MLISHRKQFIYTKTYKTAGTSVEVYFEPYCMPEGTWEEKHLRDMYVSEAGIIGYRGAPRPTDDLTWWNHMPAALIKERLQDDEKWNNYFKFCVIRNPFDKVISAYHFQTKALPNQPRWYYYRRKVKKYFNHIFFNGISPAMKRDFKRWLIEGNMFIDKDKYFIGDQMCMDYIIQYENLAQGIKAVCERLDIPFEPNRIPKFKVSSNRPKKNYAAYYDQETIDLVTRLFEFEVKLFNYHP